MVNGFIDIKKLNLEELSGVVSLYPWYGAARKELCRRMSEFGEGAWSEERYSDAALYMGSRRIMYDLAHKQVDGRQKDAGINELLKKFIEQEEPPIEKEEAKENNLPSHTSDGRQIVVVGGDYFSLSQYESVRRSDDNIFSTFATKARSEATYEETKDEDVLNFCTETLAEVYQEQGYFEAAIEIYSKLSLRYPEKSVYFAALIEKIKKNQI